MKVTIEPTEQHHEYQNPTITISYPNDAVDCEEAVDMVLNALVAWGYSYQLVFEEREVIKSLEERVKELQHQLDNKLNRPVTGQTKRSTSNARSK